VIELVAFACAAVVIGVIGVRVGMLVAPRLGRLAEREEDRDDD
jgi:hypothetical protein